MKSLELENQTLHKGVCLCECVRSIVELSCCCRPLVVENMKAALQKLESRVAVLEKAPAAAAAPCAKVGDGRHAPVLSWTEIFQICVFKNHCFHQAAPVQAAPVKQVENGGADDDDDDMDLFGSDEDDEETARVKQERLDAYAAKKSKKPALIAKSSILLDVKPVRNRRCSSQLSPELERPLQPPVSVLSFPVGRRDGHVEAGGVRALGADGRAAVGRLQTGAGGLRHQEAADQLCG